jgi:2-polyprenyl-3-methyl-5-hydroxy-6-metoxy-1,4-benzoquinol methylase
MNRFGIAKFNGKNIFGYGNVRLGPHYYKFLLEDVSRNKRVLDIGCGDGVISSVVGDSVEYMGVDIGAGCYDEVDNPNIKYIRDHNELLSYIKASKPDISMLINVLEHTFDFSGLFNQALESTKDVVLVSLPNEENIHLRLGFLFGKGINSHGLEMYGKHVNHRHLWLIQISKAEKILKNIAETYGFEMIEKNHYIAYPTTKWKRVIYKLGMLFLPWNVKSRNFILLFRKK